MLVTCWANAGERSKNLLGQILEKGKIEASGLEKSQQQGKMQWTATRNGASLAFSSGTEAWDFSPFIHLACEIQNLSDHELFVECH